MRFIATLPFLLLLTGCVHVTVTSSDRDFAEAAPEATVSGADLVRATYDKREVMVPMRDGTSLFTAIYTPRDTSRTYPFILFRTPYSSGPYGEDAFKDRLGPNQMFQDDGYIFVYQDVRGRFMSEGDFVNMTPHVADKTSTADIDESTDTYDTIEWLITKVDNHNGRVGQWGISYPGFYCSAGMIDAHPALRAVSPQAPIADWWFDDFHHHGAFFLPHSFNFLASFGRARPEPTTQWGPRFDHGTPDGYQFFLDMGPLRNANDKYLHGEIAFWNETVRHPNYDDFWQSRNILPHLNNVAPAVMTVGGWFDAEDLYGPLRTYESIEEKNPDVFNVLVMGPWRHGGWGRDDGHRLGNIQFGGPQSPFYQNDLERRFFLHYLKDEPWHDIAEATIFETGANQWHRFDEWPPAGVVERSLYCQPGNRLDWNEPEAAGHDEYVSDPSKPVPYTEEVVTGMTREYMTDDQRFAARRPDVLVYQTDVLTEDLTLAGPLFADLWVSTSGSASDWVVKLIDVHPPDAPDHDELADGKRMGGYQMMVRSEVIRGRFRNSYEHPVPFTPNEPTYVELPLQDVLHTFRAGHRVMIQIQSTWFPLVDRNPHRYVDNVFEADESDFITATQRVHRGDGQSTRLRVGVLER